MSRTPDPSRKPALLAQILEYLSDRPLTTLSFRTLATALDVSTFTLVYHFGNRAELIRDIIEGVIASQRSIEAAPLDPTSLDQYIQCVRVSVEWHLNPLNAQAQRLEFEAAVMAVLDPSSQTVTRESYETWTAGSVRALLALGLSENDATVEARVLNNIFFGFQYDIVVNGDLPAARIAFERLVDGYRDRIEYLLDRDSGRGRDGNSERNSNTDSGSGSGSTSGSTSGSAR